MPCEAHVGLIPHRKTEKITLQVGVVNGVIGKKIFAAHAPSFRNLRSHPTPKILHPVASRMVTTFDSARMHMVTILLLILSIFLFGDDHPLSLLRCHGRDQP